MMKRMLISLLMTLTACLAWCDVMAWRPVETADSFVTSLDNVSLLSDSVKAPVDSMSLHLGKVAVEMDSVNAKDHWKRVIFRHGWSINDTTIDYPAVLDFGAKTYRWLNHALNYYDTAYVVNPGKTSGKKWKIMLKNNNWLDFYSGHLSRWERLVQMNSDITSLFGFQICGMGLSFTYMINIRGRR